jgi:inner membrane protein
MTDAAPLPPPFPSPRPPGVYELVQGYLSSGNLMMRVVLLAALTLALKIPLGLVGSVVADRQSYEAEAVQNVQDSWGKAQTFAGPMIVVPYKTPVSATQRTLTLLPQKLTVEGNLLPQQRRRGLFAVTVYTATLDVVAEFPTRALREMSADGRSIDWSSAQLTLGLSDDKSIEATTVEVDGNVIEWAGANRPLASLQANLGAVALRERDTVTVRFRIAFGGSGTLSLVPLGRQTEATISSSWSSPSFMGRHLPNGQAVGKDGFKATWATSPFGRRYSQLWDSGLSGLNDPSPGIVLESAFGVTLLTPVDAYRQTDRAIKYGILFIGLTFAACLLFELATGTRPHAAQYGLIGLSLCVFYLLLLSFSEQLGFARAYLASAAAVVIQATVYNWALQRRVLPAVAFGTLLTALYGGLHALLQLEEASLLFGSVLLFAVLSVAMWLTRNLHRPAAITGLATQAQE